jgi:hypothetical protein
MIETPKSAWARSADAAYRYWRNGGGPAFRVFALQNIPLLPLKPGELPSVTIYTFRHSVEMLQPDGVVFYLVRETSTGEIVHAEPRPERRR